MRIGKMVLKVSSIILMIVFFAGCGNIQNAKNKVSVQNLQSIQSDFGFEISIPDGWHFTEFSRTIDSKIKIAMKYDIKNINQYQFEKNQEFNVLKKEWNINNSEALLLIKKDHELTESDIVKRLNFVNDNNLITINVVETSIKMVDTTKEDRVLKIINLNSGVKAQYTYLKGVGHIIAVPLNIEKKMYNGKVAKSIVFSVSEDSLMKEKAFINWVKSIKFKK